MFKKYLKTKINKIRFISPPISKSAICIINIEHNIFHNKLIFIILKILQNYLKYMK